MKMSRVLSYDHSPAPYINRRKEIVLSEQVVRQHAGTYQAPKTGLCIVTLQAKVLSLTIGDKVFILHPETDTEFFVPDRDLTFQFVNDKESKRQKMIVRENGNVVEEAVRKIS